MGLLIDMQEIASRLPAATAPKLWPTFDGGYMERGTYLSSSETGSCLRKAFYDRIDKPAFEKNGFAERGHVVEDWLVKQILPLREHGYGIEYVGDEQRTFYIHDLGLAGTPDGLITLPNSGEKVVIEVKSIDPRTNKSKLPKRGHELQLQQNILLVNACLGLDVKRGFIIYIDASNLFDQVEFERPLSLEDQAYLKARADVLDLASSADELEAEGIMNDGCDYCTHGAPCSALVAMRMEIAKKSGGSFFDAESPSGLTKAFDPTPEETILLARYAAAYKQDKDLTKQMEAEQGLGEATHRGQWRQHKLGRGFLWCCPHKRGL